MAVKKDNSPSVIQVRKKLYREQKENTKHTAAGIPTWSPTVVLICRSTAYVWQSGRDAQFSADCGRMCLIRLFAFLYTKAFSWNYASNINFIMFLIDRSYIHWKDPLRYRHSLLSPLNLIRQPIPAPHHNNKQRDTNGMQDKSAHSLCQQSSQKRRKRTTTATSTGHKTQRRHLHISIHEPCKDSRGTWIHRSKQQSQKRYSNGLAYNVRDEPDQELKRDGEDSEDVDEAFLANPGC
jgi:hypothetical protein